MKEKGKHNVWIAGGVVCAALLMYGCSLFRSGSGDELKYVSFNIWGPYFKNPVSEREGGIAEYLVEQNADLIGLQECERDFWKSNRIFDELGRRGYAWIADGKDLRRDLNPLLYRKDRLELVEGGVETFRHADNPTGSKGFSWGVFRDRIGGNMFFSYSTHFWWRIDSGEAFRRNENMRVGNARQLIAKAKEVFGRYGELPIVGGGDLNSTLLETPAALGEFDALDLKDAQYTLKNASGWSSNHGYPKRDAEGKFQAFFKPGSENPSNSLDHVHFRLVEPIALVVDRTPSVLVCSDHSPVIFTFRMNNAVQVSDK